MRTERALRMLLTLVLLLSVAPPGPAAQPAQPAQRGYPPGSHQTIRGARLWVESEGKGTPLLLIAGGPGMAHDYFHPYFSTLASTHRVIYFDALGRGRSDRARKTAEYTFSRDVEEVEALRVALGLAKMDIVGHSYGTLVAQAYTLKYPQRVRRLILISPLHSGAMWQASNDLINGQVEKTMPEVWKKLQDLRRQGFRSSAPAHRQAYRTPPGLYFYQSAPSGLPLGYNPDVYYGIVGNDADFLISGELAKLDFLPRLKSLAAPLLVLAGRHDRVALPDRVLEYRTKAPRAQIVMFEKSSHFPFIEETAAVMDRIRKFVAG